MKKIFVMCFGVFLIMTSLVFADEVYLKNGQLIEGNILKVNKVNNTLSIDIVIDNKLVGGVIILRPDEIKSISLNDNYRMLVKQSVTTEQKIKDKQARIERKNKVQEVEEAVRKNKLRKIIEEKAVARMHSIEFRQDQLIEKQYNHDKEMLKYSQDNDVAPDVNINIGEAPVISIKKSGKTSSGSTESLLLMMGQ